MYCPSINKIHFPMVLNCSKFLNSLVLAFTIFWKITESLDKKIACSSSNTCFCLSVMFQEVCVIMQVKLHMDSFCSFLIKFTMK